MKDRDSVIVEKNTNGSRRLIIYAGILVVVFLLGLVPMWLQNREVSSQLATTQNQLGRSEIKNLMTAAIVDARRGEYEPARTATSEFYTRLRAEIDKTTGSFYTNEERQSLQAIFTDRDAIITMLAQRDPASAERLTAMYAAYQTAIGQPLVTTANSPTAPVSQ